MHTVYPYMSIRATSHPRVLVRPLGIVAFRYESILLLHYPHSVLLPLHRVNVAWGITPIVTVAYTRVPDTVPEDSVGVIMFGRP